MAHMRRHVPVAYLLKNNPKLFFELLLGNVQVEGEAGLIMHGRLEHKCLQENHNAYTLHRGPCIAPLEEEQQQNPKPNHGNLKIFT